jgi:hypothetical protein
MMPEMPVQFLQEKIAELQSALFFSESDSLLRISTHVISNAEADHSGNIWFTIPRPSQHITEFDAAFPVRLDFFRKGKDFYIKILGNARIVGQTSADQELVPAEIQERTRNGAMVAIQVKVGCANYFERVPRTASNWIQNSTTQFLNWLLNPKYEHQHPRLVSIPLSLEGQAC